MRTSWIICFVAALATAGGGLWYYTGHQDMSGSYVAENNCQAFLVQVVQGQGGQLSGVYQEAQLNQDNSIDQGNSSFVGNRDGSTVAITINPSGIAEFFGTTLNLSGTINGSQLVLSGSSNSASLNLNLIKGNIETYQQWVNALKARGQAAQAQQDFELREQERAQALAKLTQDVNKAISIIGASIVQPRINQLNALSATIEKRTSIMQQQLAIEQQTGGYLSNTQRASALQQAYLADSQAITDAQLHFNDVKNNGYLSLMAPLMTFQRLCSGYGAASANINDPTFQNAAIACNILNSDIPIYINNSNRLEAAYNSLFVMWATQGPIQNSIQQAAFQ